MSDDYARIKARVLANPLASGDQRHGTVNGYGNWRCRCQPCRAAWTAYCQRRRFERSAALKPDDPRHGLASTYFNHRCRCRACKDAHNAYYQRIRARARVSFIDGDPPAQSDVQTVEKVVRSGA